MSKLLKKYVDEWEEEWKRSPENTANFSWHWHYRELYSIQNAIRSVYEKEKESLSEADKQKVDKILAIDLTDFL